ncbi:hypothetical protein [Streptomyces decoyicus]|uniref:hypothetical protein n=1 Tax=Streptomyces decoyicus TaxID=249567 RepID=UPI002E36F60F|nr:hypothetical protein [Streptomyces decoyicus]
MVKLRTELAVQVDDEENTLFARLCRGAHPYVLEELGPPGEEDRPHPAQPTAPRTPPANKLAPGWGREDRVRD